MGTTGNLQGAAGLESGKPAGIPASGGWKRKWLPIMVVVAVLLLAGAALAIAKNDDTPDANGLPNDSASAQTQQSSSRDGGMLDASGETSASQLTPTGDIRGVDWRSVIEVDNRSKLASVFYSDLTGDGREDALVLQVPQGSGEFLTYYVYTLEGSTPRKIFAPTPTAIYKGGVELGAEPGTFVQKSGVSKDGDWNCCPSNFNYKTYKWSQAENIFTVTDEHLVPNPQAGSATGS
jgi:hypothetical protein